MITILIGVLLYFATVILAAYLVGRFNAPGWIAATGPVGLGCLALAGLVALAVLAFDAGDRARCKK